MIRVLVVEDSPVVREFLIQILQSDPDIVVVGTAADGEQAIRAASQKQPDLITMDILMPRMDGLEATRRIMETDPRPIVVVSASVDVKETAAAFEALEAGALAALPRPTARGHPDHERSASDLKQTVRLMSQVKVVRRWRRRTPERKSPEPDLAPPLTAVLGRGRAAPEIKLVAIGASTGGPQALQTILSGLPQECPFPILVVQHMGAGFIEGFVEWLGHSCPMPVQVAGEDQKIMAGHIYVAPFGRDMTVPAAGTLRLHAGAPNALHCPSVASLFQSVADVYGKEAAGVLLTGMGTDGAEELRKMRDRGAITIAQDKGSSVVHGMPGEAIRLAAATYVMAPPEIASALTLLAER